MWDPSLSRNKLPLTAAMWDLSLHWITLWGVPLWDRDSPLSVVSLHCWLWHDWSLWPRLRWALSWTITRPSCRQCDNPTWSHTALLSRFHAHYRLSFWLHNQHSRLLGGSPVESLQSHSTSPVVHPFASRHEGPGFNPQGVLMWNWDSPVRVVSLQHMCSQRSTCDAWLPNTTYIFHKWNNDFPKTESIKLEISYLPWCYGLIFLIFYKIKNKNLFQDTIFLYFTSTFWWIYVMPKLKVNRKRRVE